MSRNSRNSEDGIAQLDFEGNPVEVVTDKEAKRAASKITARIVDDLMLTIRLYAGEVYADNMDATMTAKEFQEALEVLMDTQVDKKLVNRAVRKCVRLGTLVETEKGIFVLSDSRKRIIAIAHRMKNPTQR